jgi:hypothetical protein
VSTSTSSGVCFPSAGGVTRFFRITSSTWYRSTALSGPPESSSSTFKTFSVSCVSPGFVDATGLPFLSVTTPGAETTEIALNTGARSASPCSTCKRSASDVSVAVSVSGACSCASRYVSRLSSSARASSSARMVSCRSLMLANSGPSITSASFFERSCRAHVQLPVDSRSGQLAFTCSRTSRVSTGIAAAVAGFFQVVPSASRN